MLKPGSCGCSCAYCRCNENTGLLEEDHEEQCTCECRKSNRHDSEGNDASNDATTTNSCCKGAVIPKLRASMEMIEIHKANHDTIIPLEGTLANVTVSIEGMTCASCVSIVESIVGGLAPNVTCNVNLLAKKAEVQYDPSTLTPQQIADAITVCESRNMH